MKPLTDKIFSLLSKTIRITPLMFLQICIANVAQASRGAQGPYFDGEFGGGYSSVGGFEVLVGLFLWIVSGWITGKLAYEKGLSMELSVNIGIFGGALLAGVVGGILTGRIF